MSIQKRSNCSWIGMAHVRPREGNELLDGALGAFVQVLALAENEDDFIKQGADLFSEYEFDVLEWVHVQNFEERKASSDVEKSLVMHAMQLSADNPIYLDEFQAYDSM